MKDILEVKTALKPRDKFVYTKVEMDGFISFLFSKNFLY